jgi:hypothetical protein
MKDIIYIFHSSVTCNSFSNILNLHFISKSERQNFRPIKNMHIALQKTTIIILIRIQIWNKFNNFVLTVGWCMCPCHEPQAITEWLDLYSQNSFTSNYITFISCCVSYCHQHLSCKQHILASNITFCAYSGTSYLYMKAEVQNGYMTLNNMDITECDNMNSVKTTTCSGHYSIQKQRTTLTASKKISFHDHLTNPC